MVSSMFLAGQIFLEGSDGFSEEAAASAAAAGNAAAKRRQAGGARTMRTLRLL
jgi:tRNA U34 5-carboxymethylaminomethyl modifying enzyme MnmG/GidA